MEKHLFNEWTLHYEGKSYPSSCPNDVLTDLVNSGLVMDPNFGKNAEKAREFLKKPATYSAKFQLSKLPSSLHVCFEGIDTFSQVYVNGVLLGSTDNMFISYCFDASKAVRLGDNTLEVSLSPVYDHLDEKDHGWSLFGNKRLQVRKAQCHFGWDWAPDLPGYGIYLPAYFTIDDEKAISDVYLLPHNDGTVDAEVVLSGSSGKLSLNIEDLSYGPFNLKKGKNLFSFKIISPRFWFPNGYGEQPLYHYDAIVDFSNGGKDEAKGTFAFREISIVEKPLKDGRTSFGFSVNGVAIFAKGSNWVPISNQTGTIPNHSYETLLSLAKKANYNMMRVWGGGIYEKEIFYDLCDRFGILVFQDFMYSCQKMPVYPGFLNQAKIEAEYQCKRIRRHPCLCFLAGGNELYYKKEEENNPLNSLLSQVAAKLIPSIRYVPSTPFGYEEDLWSSSSGDVHQSVFEEAIKNDDVPGFEKYLDGKQASFFTECTCLGSCSYHSLVKFIPSESLWPLNGSYDYHFSTNPYALDPTMTFAMKEVKLAEGLFGQVNDAKDFAKKSMLSQAHILNKEITHARADENCHGHLNWMFNDNWGNGTWSLIDAYLEPKAAYYSQKRAFMPVLLSFVMNGGTYFLSLINEGKQPINGLVRLTYGLSEGGVSFRTEKKIVLGLGRRKKTKVEEKAGSDYLFAELVIGGRTISSDIVFFKPTARMSFKNDVSINDVTIVDGGVLLSIKANKLGYGIHLRSKERLSLSDDYFCLGEGCKRQILIEGADLSVVPKIDITTLAGDYD